MGFAIHRDHAWVILASLPCFHIILLQDLRPGLFHKLVLSRHPVLLCLFLLSIGAVNPLHRGIRALRSLHVNHQPFLSSSCKARGHFCLVNARLVVAEHVIDSLVQRWDNIFTSIYRRYPLVRIVEWSHVLRLSGGKWSWVILLSFDRTDRCGNSLLNRSVRVVELEILRDVVNSVLIKGAQLGPSVGLTSRFLISPSCHVSVHRVLRPGDNDPLPMALFQTSSFADAF